MKDSRDDGGGAVDVLGSFAFLGDGERGALIGPKGDIAWMCAPRFDSEPIFQSLMGGSGLYSVTPDERFTWGGYYETSSLIWRSRWVTTAGIIESREALSFPGDPERVVVLRRVRSLDSPQRMNVRLAPAVGSRSVSLMDLHHRESIWTARLGSLWLRWRAPEGVRVHNDAEGCRLDAQVTLSPGESLDMVLELSTRPFEDEPCGPEGAWRATELAWTQQAPQFQSTFDPQGASLAYAVMRGLTSGGGGMVAAATTSLPERAEQGRNYDYRYVWIRDQAYAGQACAVAGAVDLLDSSVGFITARLLEHGPTLAPAYCVDGTAVPDQRRIDLPGFPGGFDLVGNHVNKQFQLDAFGEALLVLAAAARLDRLDRDAERAIDVAAEAIERRWRDDDAGIWEIDNRPWTHSRLICAAGLRQAAGVVSKRAGSEVSRWSLLADQIVASTAATSLNDGGYWRRSPNDPGVDGALLLPALRGALPADDSRSVATLAAVLDQLSIEGYAYRFRHDIRPLSEAEGSFVLCGFVNALALDQQGRREEAVRWFERTAHCTGSTGIHGEEWDVGEHQVRGNLPQAFVHALHLEAAARLAGN